MSTPNNLALKLIKFYQMATSNRPSPCRFTPSCSEYGKQAFENHRLFKALRLTIYRILRCNPVGGSGYDPIPEVKCHQ